MPEVIACGAVYRERRDRKRANFVHRLSDGRHYVLTVRTIRTGDRVYVLRFHRLRKRTLASLQKRYDLIRNSVKTKRALDI